MRTPAAERQPRYTCLGHELIPAIAATAKLQQAKSCGGLWLMGVALSPAVPPF
jgi:hypothetical protein